jgi:phage baseplate assembly protein W
MAFNVQQINPLDLQPSVGVGVGLPFTSDQVFTTTFTTREAIKANLVNYFLTEQGERFFNPEIGAGLRQYIFGQNTIDTSERVEETVRAGIIRWFPNVTLNKITAQPSPDTTIFTLYINYSINMTNIQDELLITFEQ